LQALRLSANGRQGFLVFSPVHRAALAAGKRATWVGLSPHFCRLFGRQAAQRGASAKILKISEKAAQLSPAPIHKTVSRIAARKTAR